MFFFLPAWIKDLLDFFGASNDPSQTLLVASVMLLVISVIGSMFSCLRGYLFGLAGERLVARLRTRLFERLMAAEVRTFRQLIIIFVCKSISRL